MATKGELKALLATLGITKTTSRGQVKDMLVDKGYTFPEYQVYDGASKMCIVPKHADFVVKWSTAYCANEEDYDEESDSIYDEEISFNEFDESEINEETEDEDDEIDIREFGADEEIIEDENEEE